MPYYNPYQPMDRFAQTPAPYQQTQAGGGILWVQGEAGAKSYLVAPGASVLLMDSENARFYIKSSDTAGMPQPLRIFEYKELRQADTPSCDGGYVTRGEYDELKKKISELQGKLDEMNNRGAGRQEPKPKVKGAEADE